MHSLLFTYAAYVVVICSGLIRGIGLKERHTLFETDAGKGRGGYVEKKAYFYDTPIGKIGIAENGRAVTNLFFGNTVMPETYALEETELLREAWLQLSAYFAGVRFSFALPLEPEGTAFERSVWEVLQTIPYGETRTYRDLAVQLGRETACRAVGRANGRNPISIFIPCHRVIGSNGSLTGYAGGLNAKRYLLRLEQAVE